MRTSLKSIALFSVALMMLSMPYAFAEKIKCAENVDLEKYPICKYEEQWNKAQEFNEKLINELNSHYEEINDNPSDYFGIHQKLVDKVEKDNPGLKEECQRVKQWIYSKILNP